jgi:hypothetical protein
MSLAPFLREIEPLSKTLIPEDALIREFIGND